MARRRLLFVCTTLAVGGFERHIGQLVPGLRDRGFAPAAVTLRNEGAIFDNLRGMGIPTRFADIRSRLDLSGLRRAVFDSDHPDVVISQSIDAHVVAAIIGRRAGAPHVALEHAAPELLRHSRRRHVLAYRWVAPRVQRAVALSKSQIPELLRLRYGEGTIRVIPNGIPELRPVRAPSEVRAELGIAQDDFLVSLVAMLRPEKRAELFVQAVIAANRAEPSVRGVVVGGGEEFDRIRACAAASSGIVRVLGERSDIADLISASDAVGLSSVAECLPLAVLEAMALARPVVATDVGGLRDLVVDGESGLLVPPNDPGALAAAMIQLAKDPDLALAMGSAARLRYERSYTVDAMIDAYADLFDELEPVRLGRALAG
jgi:glycosyltransferase involved in cell wall biosynthesis